MRSRKKLAELSEYVVTVAKRKDTQRQARIERLLLDKEFIYTGFCGYCSRPVSKRKRWCDRVCRSLRMYGWGDRTLEIAKMLEQQRYKCAICGDGHTDNNHLVAYRPHGVIEAMLCRYCSCGVGCFMDSVEAAGRVVTMLSGQRSASGHARGLEAKEAPVAS